MRAYAARTGLPGQTHNSITKLPALEREPAHVHRSGIARDDEEVDIGVRCMASGIFGDQNRLVAGLSIAALAAWLDENWIPQLIAAAREISTLLGQRADSKISR